MLCLKSQRQSKRKRTIRSIFKWHVAEVTFDEVARLGQTSICDELVSSRNLVVVVVEASNARSGVSGNVGQGTTNTAPGEH